MSTTTSLTTTLVAPAMKGVAISEKQCPMCWGEGFPPDGSGAHDRIQELEGQVHALTARASATGKPLQDSTVFLLADYIHKHSMNVIACPQKIQQSICFYFPGPFPFFQPSHKPRNSPLTPINSLQTHRVRR